MSPPKENIVECNQPLAIALKHEFRKRYCHYCLKKYTPTLLKRCTGCYVTRYCSLDCQKSDWSLHRYECKLFKGKKDVLGTLLQRVNGPVNAAATLLTLRLYHVSNDVKLKEKAVGKHTGRRISDLMTHSEDVKRNPEKMLFYKCMLTFFQELGVPNTIQFGQEIFDIFCKILINSHSLFHWNELGESEQIALAIDLDISAYDHSCVPNADFYTKGRTSYLIPLNDSLDTHDTKATFITYADLMHSRNTRQKYLKENYFFDCKCERCSTECDSQLISIKCQKCGEAVALESEDHVQEPLPVCPKCSQIQEKIYVSKSVKLMQELGNIFTGNGEIHEDQKKLDQMLMRAYEKSREMLTETNVYRARFANYLGQYTQNMNLKIECYLLYDRMLIICYPKNFTRIFLADSIKTCHTLLLKGEFDQAKKILQRVDQTLSHYFVLNDVCPFIERIKHLRDCVKEKTVAKESVYLRLDSS